MKAKPRLLDLFCGAGGCSVGYHRAGFEVVGVDHRPMPRYPFEFHQGDALEFLAAHGREFDAIHASPPCQRFSTGAFRDELRNKHPDLLEPTRRLLQDLGRPWVIENVENAPMQTPAVRLCGLMFGLKVFRHRWFESSRLVMAPAHLTHKGKRCGFDGFVSVIGNGTPHKKIRAVAPRGSHSKAKLSAGMGIDWMTISELTQAIPPAYCEFIGRQLIDQL